MPDDAGFRPGARVRAMARRVGTRRLAIAGGAIAFLLVAAWVGNWFIVSRHMVTTENAYVRADISLISARIEGYVRAVPAAENQPVSAGDVLVEIDPTDYQARAAAASPARR